MNEQLSLIQRFRKTVIGEYAEALIWAVALALVLTTFVVQAFKIPSGSMLETLQIGDHLLVNKFLYGLRNPFNDDYLIRGVEPKVGDIIVFRYPKDRSLDYIKRIVGVPGDTLEMRNKVLYRNGVEVQEPYTQHSQPLIMIPGRDNWGPITVPADKFFALGDNRDDSADSRFWGFLDRNDIRGKAWRIYWSADGLSNIRLNRIGRAFASGVSGWDKRLWGWGEGTFLQNGSLSPPQNPPLSLPRLSTLLNPFSPLSLWAKRRA